MAWAPTAMQARAILSASFFMEFLSEANWAGVTSSGPHRRCRHGDSAANPFNPEIALSSDAPSCTYNFAFSRVSPAIRVYL
ncbi:hypothetical protein EMIT0111MI5_11117 [Burkholderia sp. IT-111MI5]